MPPDSITLKNVTMFAFDTQARRQPLISVEVALWIAYAQIEVIKTTFSQQQLQKMAVRKLASQLTSNLFSQEILLHESSYPYRLQPLGYPISFSHSNNQVACVIGACNTGIGIDLELNPISTKVSQRYFHRNELNWLHDLEHKSSTSLSLCQQARNLLWMLKEASIKALNTGQLISSLRSDFSLPAQQLFTQYQQHLQNGQSINPDAFFCCIQNPNSPPNPTVSSFIYIYLPYYHLVVAMEQIGDPYFASDPDR